MSIRRFTAYRFEMAARRSTYIVAENHSLAQPLIDALDLKRSHELEKLRVFSNESTLLMESRGGAVAAAAAVGYLLGKIGFGPQTLLVHLGRSEAIDAAGAALVGRLVLVNRVGGGGRCYYPDLLLGHEFGEAGVYTVRAGGAAEAVASLGGWPLVDAELSGVLAAALTFLAPHQLCSLTAVAGERAMAGRQAAAGGGPMADRQAAAGGRTVAGGRAGEGAEVNLPAGAGGRAVAGAGAEGHFSEGSGRHEPGRRVGAPEAGERGEEAILAAAVPEVIRLIEAQAALLRPAGAALDEELRGELEAVGEALHLTVTQSAQLRRLAEAAAAQGGDVAGIVAGWRGTGPVRSKQERNRRFDELKRGFEI